MIRCFGLGGRGASSGEAFGVSVCPPALEMEDVFAQVVINIWTIIYSSPHGRNDELSTLVVVPPCPNLHQALNLSKTSRMRLKR